MKKQTIDFLKLGVFVVSGLVILIISLYMLGRNRSFFGDRLEISTRFKNINGLLEGNNVRFNGINVGNVKSIEIINDTTIEVVMSLKKEMRGLMRKNSIATIGTDGLIGNRIVNINSAGQHSEFLAGGEMLASKEEVSTDAMLRTLEVTNQNINEITEEVKLSLKTLKTSSQLSKILNDSSLALNLSASLMNLRKTTEKANVFANQAILSLKNATEGPGSLATILSDTIMANELKDIISQMKNVENKVQNVLQDIGHITQTLSQDLNNGKGSISLLLKDSSYAMRLSRSLENIEVGTASFAEDMKALQSNFLLRAYFKKKEKELKNNK